MPKRKNPFGDTAPLQLKVHVGFKQAATEAEKEEVYAKTKALLFQGAKKAHNGLNGSVAPFTSNGFSHHKENTSHLLQMNGKHKTGPVNGVVKCKGCLQREANKMFVCSHCQASVCGEECFKQCCVCAQWFCPYCSVLNYDEREVRSFCFDCLPIRS